MRTGTKHVVFDAARTNIDGQLLFLLLGIRNIDRMHLPQQPSMQRNSLMQRLTAPYYLTLVINRASKHGRVKLVCLPQFPTHCGL